MSWEIRQGDCRELLREVADASASGIVTDPPFNLGYKYASYDDNKDPGEYGEWLWSILELAESKLLPGSPVFVWQGLRNMHYYSEWFPRDFRIFVAAKSFVQVRPTAMQWAWDPVLVWWTEGKQWFDPEPPLGRDWHSGNMMSDRLPQGSHPCPRPLDTLQYIIGQWVRPGGLVLDPFAGSGTTGVACVNLGRDFLGFEIDPGYCDLARRRLAGAQEPLLTA